MAHAEGSAARPRPTSPHLQIYSPLINMVMSIVHRITGAALYFGSLLLSAWLVSAAMGPEAYEQVNALFGSIIGRIVLIGYTWALIHHMLGGVRHFIWDTGRGLDIKTADFLCWSSIVLSILLTAAIWFAATTV
ncbi:MAG: succinate dehydrogenase, cytochrome b556 subunit [Alphaproteobacteria bacterium]|nr:succinate dehydrogenase, cytochrome b556 subunit [Alphaproteobacteria bacterium]